MGSLYLQKKTWAVQVHTDAGKGGLVLEPFDACSRRHSSNKIDLDQCKHVLPISSIMAHRTNHTREKHAGHVQSIRLQLISRQARAFAGIPVLHNATSGDDVVASPVTEKRRKR